MRAAAGRGAGRRGRTNDQAPLARSRLRWKVPRAASAARIYVVDASAGQLRGWLRADPRVINLERTNLTRLGPHLITEPADLITMDLSCLAIADAAGQVGPQLLAPAAQLIALVKPAFELHAATLADQPQQVAVETPASALEDHGWRILCQQASPILGAKERSKCSATPHPDCRLRKYMSPIAGGLNVYVPRTDLKLCHRLHRSSHRRAHSPPATSYRTT